MSTSPSDSPRRKKFKTSNPLEDNENYRLQSLEKSISQVKITTSVQLANSSQRSDQIVDVHHFNDFEDSTEISPSASKSTEDYKSLDPKSSESEIVDNDLRD
ncbi:GSCOCG00010883001-RA-CDS, partial [Cotesia congregata]